MTSEDQRMTSDKENFIMIPFLKIKGRGGGVGGGDRFLVHTCAHGYSSRQKRHRP